MSIDRKMLDDLNQSTLEQFQKDIRDLQISLQNIPEIKLELFRNRKNPEKYQILFDVDTTTQFQLEAEKLLGILKEKSSEIKDYKTWEVKYDQYLNELEKNIRSIANDYVGKEASSKNFQLALNNSINDFTTRCHSIKYNYFDSRDSLYISEPSQRTRTNTLSLPKMSQGLFKKESSLPNDKSHDDSSPKREWVKGTYPPKK